MARKPRSKEARTLELIVRDELELDAALTRANGSECERWASLVPEVKDRNSERCLKCRQMRNLRHCSLQVSRFLVPCS